jgi:glycerate dehydrogenase
MKIVVLDGHTLNPGDQSWDQVKALGEFTVYDHTPADQVVECAKDADVVLTNKVILDKALLNKLHKLQFVGVLATGYNIVDVEAARERGIPVTNVPTYGTQSVAQMVFAHLLNLTQHVAHHADTVKAGRWSVSPDFCYWDFPLIELAGLTIGIVGYGRIGRNVAAIAKAFEMQVLAYDAFVTDSGDPQVSMVDLDTLFAQSDVVTLHCPLTPETDKLVNAQRLLQMKPSAFLINTSRGPIVDNDALADALNAGTIAGAGLDVLDVEPPPMSNPLMTAQNCYITPHISWATHSARARLLGTVAENIKAWMAGKPINVVNP